MIIPEINVYKIHIFMFMIHASVWSGLDCMFNVESWPKSLKSKFTQNALLWIHKNLFEHFWQLFHVIHQDFSFKSPNSCTLDTCCDTEVRKNMVQIESNFLALS